VSQEFVKFSNIKGQLDILRRTADRLQKYGEYIEDHSVVTTALHLQDEIKRTLKILGE